MTNELKVLLERIDYEFVNYFGEDKSVKTIFVAGSMAHDDYEDRIDNDYDIRVISDVVTKEKIQDFENFLKEISKKLTSEDLAVGYSCLVGPVNHKVASNKKNVLIHAMIHQKEQMDDFLPVTHKYQYGTRYRIVYGEDSLKRFQDVRYNLDELLNAHEGLRYCIDMLEKREYRYLSWDTTNNDCSFNFHTARMTDDIILENCFYSVNKFINNLINYCNWNNYDIPHNKICFAIRLLGEPLCIEDTIFLLKALFTKDEKVLNLLFDNPLDETINLLKQFEKGVLNLDYIFPKKEQDEIKVKKKIRNG